MSLSALNFQQSAADQKSLYEWIRRTLTHVHIRLTEIHFAGCSKRSDFSPAQPWRATSPTRPESAKTASSPKDAPYPRQGHNELSLFRGGWDDPNCAQYSTHPALSTPRRALSRARAFQSSRYLPFEEWPRLPSTARIERGHSNSLTSPEGVGRPFFTARIERPPLYRGGSASKKNGLPAPSHPSEAARCASTGIVPATPPLFQHPARSSSRAGHTPSLDRRWCPGSPRYTRRRTCGHRPPGRTTCHP